MTDSTIKCGIEHHATLFALLAKHAVKLCGEAGRQSILDGMDIYGRERGSRMANNARTNNDTINLVNNQAYGEWRPDYPSQMKFGILQTEPSFTTYISKCAWCEAWRKHGLLEYGKLYCVNVDNAVYEGFQESEEEILVCTPISTAMSWGGERCDFDWGRSLSKEEVLQIEEKKEQIGNKYVKDFNYHTGHIYNAISTQLIKDLGDKGEHAINEATIEFSALFGFEYLQLAINAYKK